MLGPILPRVYLIEAPNLFLLISIGDPVTIWPSGRLLLLFKITVLKLVH